MKYLSPDRAPVGSTPLKDRNKELIASIGGVTTQQFLRAFPGQISSIILTGSLSRDEGTLVQRINFVEVLGDAEFVVIMCNGAKLPPNSVVVALCESVARILREGGLIVEISAAVVRDGFLRTMTPQMFAYELRNCGRVIWGEPRILELVPPFGASEIGLEDAWRTLCNRSIETLEAIASADVGQPTVPRDVFYRVVKLYLDMATSLLLFVGKYEPGYAARSQMLTRLVLEEGEVSRVPFPLAEFTRRVVACTSWKLTPDEASERSATWDWCCCALDYAAKLWRWELLRLTQAPATSDNDELIAIWTSMQSVLGRVRGWLYVSRESGALQTCRHWLRWLRLSRLGSPRYGIYAAAGNLLPQVAGLGHLSNSTLLRLQNALPLPTSFDRVQGVPAWVPLAKEIGTQYHRFLEHTRA